MANPLEDLYTNWLKTLATAQPGLQAAPQQWQKAVSDLWQMPSAYWQTVASIMSGRAQGMQQLAEKAPQNFQALASCKSWPEFVGKAAAIQGDMLASLIKLDLSTNAYRAGLWREWCQLAERNRPQTQSPAQPQPRPVAKPAPQPQPQPQKAPQPAPQPQAAAQPAPPPKPVVSTTPSPTPIYPTQVQAASKPELGQRKPIFTQMPPRPLVAKASVAATNSVSTPASRPQQEMPLLTGTNGTGTVTSPTANSVMRSSTGATVAAGAAARRSVVARRQSRRRTPR